jgi:peptidoglycan/xylan/chitin deacetylase (PgdA/CDA1 family)
MKRRVRFLISLLFHAVACPGRAVSRWAGRTPPGTCVVLYYHGIAARHRQLFARQLDSLLDLAQPFPSHPTEPFEPGRHHAIVTFDDGFRSVMDNARPELDQRGIPWTVFVPSGLLGQAPDWLRHAPESVRQDRVMTADELRDLARDPRVTIGSHTVSHTHLIEAGPTRAADEFARSKAELETVIERSVDQFSYPFGARNPALDALGRQAGYRRLFCSVPALAYETADEWVTGRANVDPSMPLLEFRLKLLGAYRWLARRHRGLHRSKTADHTDGRGS